MTSPKSNEIFQQFSHFFFGNFRACNFCEMATDAVAAGITQPSPIDSVLATVRKNAKSYRTLKGSIVVASAR